MTERCSWCGEDPLYVAYHDREWGVPQYDSQILYEKLMLDGFQAGLSWITILRKRENFQRAFDGFDPERVASYGPADVERILGDAGVVRHRAKIEATIGNAQAYLRVSERMPFSDFLWDFVDGEPIQNRFATVGEVPAQTPLSNAISKALKKEGFKFCGPTIVYAVMQAMGMVNDHLIACHRHAEVAALARR